MLCPYFIGRLGFSFFHKYLAVALSSLGSRKSKIKIIVIKKRNFEDRYLSITDNYGHNGHSISPFAKVKH